MKREPLKWIGMMICAAAFVAAAGRASLGEGLADLPDLSRQTTARIPAERLIPPKTDTAALTDTRHAAMLDATRGTKVGLVGGRRSALEPVSLADPEAAAKRLQPPGKPPLILEPLPEFSKPELTIEALADDRKAR